jgi:hypothetical protein
VIFFKKVLIISKRFGQALFSILGTTFIMVSEQLIAAAGFIVMVKMPLKIKKKSVYSRVEKRRVPKGGKEYVYR